MTEREAMEALRRVLKARVEERQKMVYFAHLAGANMARLAAVMEGSPTRQTVYNLRRQGEELVLGATYREESQ